MTTAIVQFPFVTGIDVADDVQAPEQFGKLDRAHNVCVRPSHRNVLSKRGGVAAYRESGAELLASGRILNVDGRPLIVTENGSFNVRTADSFPVQLISNTYSANCRKQYTVSSQWDDYVVSQGTVADSALGTQLDWVVSYNQAGTTMRVSTVSTYSGRSDVVLVAIEEAVTVESPRIFGYFRTGVSVSTAATLVRHQAGNIERCGASGLSVVTIVAATRLLDADIDASTGHFLILYTQADGSTKLSSINRSTDAIVNTSTVQASPFTSPTIGVLMANVNGSTLHHVLLGGATADLNRLRPHSVIPGAAPTDGTAFSNPYGSGVTLQYLTGGTPKDGTSGVVAGYTVQATATEPEYSKCRLLSISSGLVVSNIAGLRGVPCSKLWYDPTVFLGARVLMASARRIALIQAYFSNAMAAVNYGSLRGWSAHLSQGNCQAYFGAVGSGSAIFAVPVVISGSFGLLTGPGPYRSDVDIVSVSPGNAIAVSHGGFNLIVGGRPALTTDGSGFQSAGLPQPPIVTATISAAGGSIAAGAYSYAVVFETFDEIGRVIRSAPTVFSVTHPGGATNSVTLRISLESNSAGATEFYTLVARVVVYRSQVGGTTLHRISFDTSASADMYVSVDTYADSVIASSEILDVTNLPNSEIEATHAAIGFSDRFVGALSPDPSKLWYSKSFETGRVVEYDQALTFQMPAVIEGLATQDGNIYAFARNDVYAFFPSFADDAGLGGAAPDVNTLSAGIGVKFPNSIVTTPEGIFFCSDRGFFLCAKGGGPPTFIGAPVERYLTATGTITGAAFNPATLEVAFVLSETASHLVLIYNIDVKQWYTWAFHDNSYAMAGGVCVVDGVFWFCDRSAGRAAIAMTGLTDAGNASATYTAPPVPVIETRDFDFSNFGEIQRVRSVAVECTAIAGDTLSVEESTDSGVTYGAAQTFAAELGPLQYQVTQQKSKTHRVRITGAPAAASTAWSVAGLAIEMMQIKRTGRVAVAQKKG